MCSDCGCEEGLLRLDRPSQTITLGQDVLSENDRTAARNRAWLRARGVRSLNLISSPGAGKTTLLTATLDALRGHLRCAVIAGDVQTELDAQALRGHGAEVAAIETRSACHLDAARVAPLLPELVNDQTQLLLVENVGNLVCPAAFDLGTDKMVALLSVTEGDDKPLKYPALFHRTPIVLVTKTDLLPYLDVELEMISAHIRAVRPDAQILPLSARSGAGMAAWLDLLLGWVNP